MEQFTEDFYKQVAPLQVCLLLMCDQEHIILSIHTQKTSASFLKKSPFLPILPLCKYTQTFTQSHFIRNRKYQLQAFFLKKPRSLEVWPNNSAHEVSIIFVLAKQMIWDTKEGIQFSMSYLFFRYGNCTVQVKDFLKNKKPNGRLCAIISTGFFIWNQ